MKKEFLLFLSMMLVVFSCTSQHPESTKVQKILKNNIKQIEFSNLTFFSEDLIKVASDTNFQSKFVAKLRAHRQVIRKTHGDELEYKLPLHLLYKVINAEHTYTPEFQKGKDFLLEALKDYKVMDFQVNDSLILMQIDNTKRSMLSGYDEGSTGESSFTFFCYNPLLYKETLLNNDLHDDWNRMSTFLCNYIRQNENPLEMRGYLKERIIQMLAHSKAQNQFDELISEFSQCDVSLNLFD